MSIKCETNGSTIVRVRDKKNGNH